MIILICGFTGSGKSTLLKKCRDDFGKLFDCIDLDEMVCAVQNISCDQLGEFIRRVGFERFRQLETETLLSVCGASSGDVLVALGGGTTWHGVIDRETVKVIWLDTPFDSCYQRISADRNRPVADLGREDLYKIYMERLVEYQKADYRICSLSIDSKQISEIFVNLSPDNRSQKG